MLVIRRSQMEALGLAGRESFEETVARHLRLTHPEHPVLQSDADMRAFARHTIQIAAEHGIETRGSIIEFAGLWLTFGEKFELSPDDTEAMEILEDPDFPGQLKVMLLKECLAAASGGRTITSA
jgi:hypothetical protein